MEDRCSEEKQYELLKKMLRQEVDLDPRYSIQKRRWSATERDEFLLYYQPQIRTVG
ncbi:hypothetical protein OB236_25535 [Paenibacillus sp. WQ 127069]|uniref:Uncharacterized protein n=1 Tax=Paenibacillus baimaensis TaxID=2982185 RepID=A0ABT2ULE8_9BACL|nr:hypothetical protein [Paenibacillus sp. WQ 127069]